MNKEMEKSFAESMCNLADIRSANVKNKIIKLLLLSETSLS